MSKKALILVLFAVFLTSCSVVFLNLKKPKSNTLQKTSLAGKKLVYINSYHPGYEWSDGIEKGAKDVLSKTPGLRINSFYLDAKRNTNESFIVKKALEIRDQINVINPDIIISADDAAFKYIIMPYYKDTSTPVVFGGINWDASIYGAPYSNTTGMIEVSLFDTVLAYLKNYANVQNVGYISNDEISERKEIEMWEKYYNMKLNKRLVTTTSGWKKAFLELQNTSSVILINNNAAISDWNKEEMIKFMEENTKIPSATFVDYMMDYCLLGVVKDQGEQGQWSAETAIKILSGTPVKDIPVTKNIRGDLYLNFRLAKKLNITFTPFMIKTAKKIIE